MHPVLRVPLLACLSALALASVALGGCNDLVGVDFGSEHLGVDASGGGTGDASMGSKHEDASHTDGASKTKDDSGTKDDGGTPAKCKAKTCSELSAVCGAADDGCGGVLQCGTCTDTDLCLKGKCQCQPKTCPDLGATCGEQDDGCGNAINCGTCLPSQVCTDNSCVCAPTTCLLAGATCGDLSDGCGNTLDCGACMASDVCGGGGPNVCGPAACVPSTCATASNNCGMISDGCGNQLDCGTCTAPQICSGGGTANVCGCTPTTCTTLGLNCGTAPDGCGNTLTCGTCTSPDTCAGAAVADVCGCTPTTCAALGDTCGAPSNGCGGTLSCGTCTSPDTCVSGTCKCVPTTCGLSCGDIPNGCGGTLVCKPCITCFGRGTDITMADGSHEAIETVHVGDRVMSYDTGRSAWVSATVLSTPVHAAEEGTGEFIIINGGLRLTSNHPVWTGSQTKRADLLEIGDPIVTLSPASPGREPVRDSVRSIQHVASHEVTYDLDVSSAGTSTATFVAEGLVVAHKVPEE